MALTMVASLRGKVSGSDRLLSMWLSMDITPYIQLPAKHVLFHQGYSELRLSLLNCKW